MTRSRVSGSSAASVFSVERIERLVREAMSDARVRVTDLTGGGDHFEIEVISASFEGVPLLERHRRLHAILEGPMEGEIHAVKLRALAPPEAAGRG